MKNIWITSDTHYNHANILNFTDSTTGNRIRPEFSNVDEMNECLIDSWNSVIKPGDLVYHLGDVFFGSKEKFEKDWPKFNGRKRLIVGNHDDIRYLSSGSFFQKVMMIRQFPEYGLMLSHYPLHEQSLYNSRGKDFTNVHGHIHQNDSPPGPYINMSVEKTNYTPIHIEELKQ